MFNPLVDSFDNLTDSDIENKIVELQRKYFLTHNPSLQNQISVILDMYKEEARSRRAKQFAKLNNQDNNDLDSLINIS